MQRPESESRDEDLKSQFTHRNEMLYDSAKLDQLIEKAKDWAQVSTFSCLFMEFAV